MIFQNDFRVRMACIHGERRHPCRRLAPSKICAYAQKILRYRITRYRRRKDWIIQGRRLPWIKRHTYSLYTRRTCFTFPPLNSFGDSQIKAYCLLKYKPLKLQINLSIKRQFIFLYKIRITGNIICFPFFFYLDNQFS